MSEERKPKWAWTSVDDPNPHYPKCDRCTAFARWSIGIYEQPTTTRGDWTIRAFVCGRHLGPILVESGESEWMVYDITEPPERS